MLCEEDLDKISPLNKHGQLVRNEDPNVYYPSNNIHIYSTDKDHAVKTAKRLLLSLSEAETDLYLNYIFTVFETWKLEFGVPLEPPKNKQSQISSFLFQIKHFENYEEDERLNGIKNIKPWEAMPYGAKTPLNLLNTIYATNYQNVETNRMHYYYALLIVHSDTLNDKRLWPEMIRQSLWISDILLDSYETSSQRLFKGYKSLSNDLNNRKKGLLTHNQAKIRQAEIKKKAIHEKASEYINNNTPLHSVVSKLERFGNFNLSKKQIRKHLQDHPLTNHWKPQKKK